MAFYAPQIGRTILSLVNPCATTIEQPDISRLLRGPQTPGAALVQPFFLHAANPAEQDRAVRCLTDAIYYEAANEPVEGQRAIAQVIVNRVRDKHFPKSVCGVVYEGWEGDIPDANSLSSATVRYAVAMPIPRPWTACVPSRRGR